MPTKRNKRMRVSTGLIPEELQWLTGRDVEGAGKLWSFRGGAAKAERCRVLIREYAHLVPRGRMAQLKRDIKDWDDPPPVSGLASFR